LSELKGAYTGHSIVGELYMRVLIVQYSGDYRQAVKDFANHKEETYYAQNIQSMPLLKSGKKSRRLPLYVV
jgi:hypothetical protein